MKYKPLTIDNIVQAACIYLSEGNDYKDIKDLDFLQHNHAAYSIQIYSAQCLETLKQNREYEFIFSVKGSNRCRMYFYPDSDFEKRHSFPEAKYMIGVTHMSHINGPREEVKDRFTRMRDALLREGYPAVRF